MSMDTETTAEAWRRRTANRGAVDFTMMYVAHDAFRRDLSRLIAAADAARVSSPEARATWAMFHHQLHTHHGTEDSSLWPRVRDSGLSVTDADVLSAMEAEHHRLDPLLGGIETAFEDGGPHALQLRQLAGILDAHMLHEETEALPIVERTVGRSGWNAFGKDIRDAQGGIKAGAAYLPWVLDGAPESARRTVLKVLPPPARLLYTRVWEPKYKRAPHLG